MSDHDPQPVKFLLTGLPAPECSPLWLSMTVSVAAIIPPSNVDHEVTQIQKRILQLWGCASCMALPPLIPVCALPHQTTGDDFRALMQGAIPDFGITIGTYVVVEDHVFLETHCSRSGAYATGQDGPAGAVNGDIWSFLRQTIQSRCGMLPGPDKAIVPMFAGLHLCATENKLTKDELCAQVDPPRESHFTSCSLCLVTIESPSKPAFWWKEVYWEQTACIKIKQRTSKTRRGGPPGDGS